MIDGAGGVMPVGGVNVASSGLTSAMLESEKLRSSSGDGISSATSVFEGEVSTDNDLTQ